MRLDKFLANMGLGSRKDVHKLIAAGKVTVDGVVVADKDAKIREESQCVAAGGRVIPYKPFVYIMINKPAGYVSSTDDGDGPCVTDLLEGRYGSYRLGVAGRLDKDAEGLLLLTNDGAFIHRVISPEKHVVKRYYTELAHGITAGTVALFAAGVRLRDGTVFKSASLRKASAAEGGRGEHAAEGGPEAVHAAITGICEGKFHQVKKMFLAADNEVLYLKRLSIGGLVLDPALRPGEFRELRAEEAAMCEQAAPAEATGAAETAATGAQSAGAQSI